MNAVNYNGALSQKPFFDSPKVGDNFAAFEKRIEALEKKMMDLVGLNREWYAGNMIRFLFPAELRRIRRKTAEIPAELNGINNW